MQKPSRAFFGVAALVVFLTALPVSAAVYFKTSFYSALSSPLAFSRNASQFFLDLFYFRRNAEENEVLRGLLAKVRLDKFQREELLQENARLSHLLELKQTVPASVKHSVAAKVIARSPSLWNRVLLIDKGTQKGVHRNMLVLSDSALIGRVVEAGPFSSKVLLVNDPECRIGVLLQRTRQQGVLYGASNGGCRIKYLPLDADVNAGDLVETAGFGGFFPKGLLIGAVQKTWKEPGQIYQVAAIKPFSDFGKLEEVTCVE